MMSSAKKKNPQAPILIWDGDCGFCRLWVNYWKAHTGQKVQYRPYQEVADEIPQISEEKSSEAVQLLEEDGSVYSGAAASLRVFSYVPGRRWLYVLYRKVIPFAWLADKIYKGIARHRSFFYRVTRLLWGTPRPDNFRVVRWLFLRIFGIVLFGAFISFASQISGLIGANGILPAGQFLKSVSQQLGFFEQIWRFPTLGWLSASEGFLHFLAYGGAILAFLVVFDVFTRWALLGALIFYLSLIVVGQDFMSYQWDALLIEAGVLGLFLQMRSTASVWLFRLLLFKFVLLAGATKLMSGDAAWRDLTALNFHYFTQPIPNPLAWYIHQLPAWFDKASVLLTFLVQLGVVWLIWLPRRARFVAAGGIALLEMGIFLTGNYTFLNILTIAMTLFLLDDRALQAISPQRWFAAWRRWSLRISFGRMPRFGYIFLAVLVILNLLVVSGVFFGKLPQPARAAVTFVRPWKIVNSYGLFADITTKRPELIVEGSRDGEKWKAYEFTYKPGDLTEMPAQVAPHQPRLDWQMWFAALTTLDRSAAEGKEKIIQSSSDGQSELPYQYNRWFIRFVQKLLQGSPAVTGLMEHNPFPHNPPRYIRVVLYDYKFTTFSERDKSGRWWKRERLGLYLSPVSLKNFR